MTSPFPFRADEKLTTVLKETKFTISAEIIPPRNGAEQAEVLLQIQSLVDAGAQFLAVTKGAGGSLRGGSLPIAQAIKERFGVPCIAHFTCRDLVPAEVENLLMDHHYFGIRNILALRGDPPEGQPEWKARDGGYNYAYQLMEQISNLNRGIYLKRHNGPEVKNQEATDFCIGTAVYPEAPDEADRIEFFKRKVQAGAEFAITNMLFDPDLYSRFLDQAARSGLWVPVLPGTRLLGSQKQALKMVERFKVPMPNDLLQMLPEKEGPDSFERSMEVFLEMVERFKKRGAPGVHLFVITDMEWASFALKRLAEKEKEKA